MGPETVGGGPETGGERAPAASHTEGSDGGAREGRPFVHAPGWIIFGVPALALALLAWVELGELNESLFRWGNALSLHTGPSLWAHLTILGDGLVCTLLFLPWVRRHPERVWGGVLGAILMVLVLHLLKDQLNLPRPLAVLPEGSVHLIGPPLRREALPSGHTATFALYAGIWALSTRRRWISLLLLIPLVLVGVSRLAVGAHWPADVLAGLALGWLSAYAGLRWAAWAPWGLRRTPRLVLASALLACALVAAAIDHTGYPGVLGFQRSLAGIGFLWGAWGTLSYGRRSRPGGHDGPGATGL